MVGCVGAGRARVADTEPMAVADIVSETAAVATADGTVVEEDTPRTEKHQDGWTAHKTSMQEAAVVTGDRDTAAAARPMMGVHNTAAGEGTRNVVVAVVVVVGNVDVVVDAVVDVVVGDGGVGVAGHTAGTAGTIVAGD